MHTEDPAEWPAARDDESAYSAGTLVWLFMLSAVVATVFEVLGVWKAVDLVRQWLT